MKWAEVHPPPSPLPPKFLLWRMEHCTEENGGNQPSYREDTNFSAQRFYLEIIDEILLTNLPQKAARKGN